MESSPASGNQVKGTQPLTEVGGSLANGQVLSVVPIHNVNRDQDEYRHSPNKESVACDSTDTGMNPINTSGTFHDPLLNPLDSQSETVDDQSFQRAAATVQSTHLDNVHKARGTMSQEFIDKFHLGIILGPPAFDHSLVNKDNMQLSPRTELENMKNAGIQNKKGRRVVFPEDETIVTSYLEPANPWKDATSRTTEDLVTAYLFSCDKHGTQPIPRLLNQLQAISDFCDRNETFTLKGEKLDSRQCETLEEVFRRVQFRTIDLENTHLDDEGAVSLFDMVEYYESCIKINISYNKNMGPRGWQACSKMLKKTPCVETLEARSCNISEQVMPMLGRALRMGSQLRSLHLENSILSGRPLMILVTAIKMNNTLTEVYLADNRLMPTDGIQLGNMLKFNQRLQVLDLRNNHLQDVGTSHLCDGLFEQNSGTGLNTLVLWNNQVTYQSMANLARALVSTKHLETINLGHNNITNEGVYRLKDALLSNKSLLRIGLQAAKVSCEGAIALAEYIADSPRLVRIDLRENDIKTGGLMALSLALKVSQTLTRIDLDKDPKKESGMKDYAEQQRRLHQDMSELMIRNRELTRKREEKESIRIKLEQKAAEAEKLAAVAAEEEKISQQEIVNASPIAKSSGTDEAESSGTDEAESSGTDEAELSGIVEAEKQVEPVDIFEENAVTQEVPREIDHKPSDIVQDSVTESQAQISKVNDQGEKDDVDLHLEVTDTVNDNMDSPRKADRLNLSLSLTAGSQSLESPCFVKESDLPIVSPPSEEQVAEAAAARQASTVGQELPIEIPPSPMVPKPFVRELLHSGSDSPSMTLVSQFQDFSEEINPVKQCGINSSETELTTDDQSVTASENRSQPPSSVIEEVNERVVKAVDTITDKIVDRTDSQAAGDVSVIELNPDTSGDCAGGTPLLANGMVVGLADSIYLAHKKMDDQKPDEGDVDDDFEKELNALIAEGDQEKS